MANGAIPKIIIGGGLGIVTSVMAFMGNGIVENDRRNTDQHIEMRAEVHQSVIAIKDDISDMRAEQKSNTSILARIEKKL